MKLKHFSTPVVVIGLLIPATTACNQETTISRDEETALNSEGETTNRSEEEQAPSVKNLDAMGSFIGTKNELSGTICFNNIIGKWFIQVPIKGTIDNVDCYFPVEMSKALCTENTQVLLSGKVYQLEECLKKQIPLLAGYEYYAIEITEMKEDQK
ncbi:MAG: hypothetical protein J5545_07595 [Bacteroidaceae bacterium]|nr:hypothetical protein [Bacteroidaceae bacterium]